VWPPDLSRSAGARISRRTAEWEEGQPITAANAAWGGASEGTSRGCQSEEGEREEWHWRQRTVQAKRGKKRERAVNSSKAGEGIFRCRTVA